MESFKQIRFSALDNENFSFRSSGEKTKTTTDFVDLRNVGLTSKEQRSTAARNLLKEIPGQS